MLIADTLKQRNTTTMLINPKNNFTKHVQGLEALGCGASEPPDQRERKLGVQELDKVLECFQ